EAGPTPRERAGSRPGWGARRPPMHPWTHTGPPAGRSGPRERQIAAMLAEVVRQLRCPLCAAPFTPSGGALRCHTGHSFDVARQGYVNLLPGRPPAGVDSPEMVAARDEVLRAGLFDFLTRAVVSSARRAAAEAAAETPSDAEPGLIVDVGAGTGHYLAAVLDALPDRRGIAVDVAKAAVRRAARAHPRAVAVVADVWRGLPVADGCADLLLDIFAPRNAREFRRALRPRGRLIVVTPGPQHLAELVERLGLLAVDPHKDRRLEETLAGAFRLDHREDHAQHLSVGPADVTRLVAMGPSAWQDRKSTRLNSSH